MRKKRRTGYFITVAALVCSLIGNSVVVSMAADQEYSEVEVQENKNPDMRETKMRLIKLWIRMNQLKSQLKSRQKT